MDDDPSREALRADQRRRLLNATADVVSRDGFAGARIQDIAREAHVSLRTFYDQFETKEQVFLALHEEITEHVVVRIEESIVFDRPLREVMTDAFATAYAALAASTLLTRAASSELAALSDEAREQRERAMERFAQLLLRLVERARAAYPGLPTIPLEPAMARGIVGSVVELVEYSTVRDELARLPVLAETSAEMLWRLITHVEPAVGEPDLAAKSGESGIVSSGDADIRR